MDLSSGCRSAATAFLCLLWTLSIVFSGASTARAQKLIIKPWDANESQLLGLFRDLPAEWKQASDVVYIETVPQKELMLLNLYIYPDSEASLMSLEFNLEGQYLEQRAPDHGPTNMPIAGPMIFLSINLNEITIPRVFTHEWGHHVYFTKITKEDQESWDALWRKLSKEHRLPTPYSTTNAREGFAECFQQYIRSVRGTDPEIIQWFMGLRARRIARTEAEQNVDPQGHATTMLPIVTVSPHPPMVPIGSKGITAPREAHGK